MAEKLKVKDLQWLLKGCSVQLAKEYVSKCEIGHTEECPNWDVYSEFGSGNLEDLIACEDCGNFCPRNIMSLAWYGDVDEIPIKYSDASVIRIIPTTYVETIKKAGRRILKKPRMNLWNHIKVIIEEHN